MVKDMRGRMSLFVASNWVMLQEKKVGINVDWGHGHFKVNVLCAVGRGREI